VKLLFYTAIRASDMVNIRIEHVDVARDTHSSNGWRDSVACTRFSPSVGLRYTRLEPEG
jgi:hypothetical protein